MGQCSTAFVRSFVVTTCLLGAAAPMLYSQSYVATTLAGADRVREGSAATTVPLRSPTSVAVDRSGNVYFVDDTDARVREISTSGVLTTVAGNGTLGFSGDGGPATQATLWDPTSVAVDSAGNIYIADQGNERVRKVSASGTITTIAGNGNYLASGDGGLATAAGMDPAIVAVDNAGNVYIGDAYNYLIRKVDAAGRISTVAGTGKQGTSGENVGATTSPIGRVDGLTVDAQGNLYYSELPSNRVRKLTAAGVATSVAGNGLDYHFSGDNGPATSAQLYPQGVVVDGAGNLYVADLSNNRIRKITPSGTITTIAGTGVAGSSGDGGPATAATLSGPVGLALDSAGNLYVADRGNGRIRKISTSGIITTIAGAPLSGNGQASSIFLNRPNAVAVDGQGNVYIADFGSNLVRKVAANGFSTVLAGTGQPGYTGDGASALQATLNGPQGVAVDGGGNVYVADSNNYAVRRISTDGTIATVAGIGLPGYSGDQGPATAARIGYVTSVAADNAGNFYFNDLSAQAVRKVTSNGTITRLAGTADGKYAYSGDNGPAINAGVNPFDIAADQGGNVYIADRANNRIRRVIANGTITTLAGTGLRGYAGDGARALDAQLASPTGVAVDSTGGVYIADEGNYLLRKVSGTGIITTIAGSGLPTSAGDNGPARLAGMDPYRVALDNQGNIYVADEANDRVRKLAIITATQILAVSGDGQNGAVGDTLANPLIVQAVNANGVGVAGVPVTFTVTSGSALVVPSVATTAGDGTAGARLVLQASGTVTVVATAANLAPVTFTVTVNGALTSVGGPQISTGGVVGAGTGTLRNLAANSLATVFGSNFGTPGVNATATPVNGAYGTNLAGTCVYVGGVAAPVLAVTAGQVNFLVPNVGAGVTGVQVATNCGQSNEVRSNSENIVVQSAAPEFFYFSHSGNGIDPIAAVDATTGLLIGPASLGAQFSAAKAGDVVTLYVTGLGATQAGLPVGQVPAAASSVSGPVQIMIGNVTLSATDIAYVGLAPGYAGLYQINLRVPATVQPGTQPVTLTVNGTAAPAGGYLLISQ